MNKQILIRGTVGIIIAVFLLSGGVYYLVNKSNKSQAPEMSQTSTTTPESGSETKEESVVQPTPAPTNNDNLLDISSQISKDGEAKINLIPNESKTIILDRGKNTRGYDYIYSASVKNPNNTSATLVINDKTDTLVGSYPQAKTSLLSKALQFMVEPKNLVIEAKMKYESLFVGPYQFYTNTSSDDDQDYFVISTDFATINLVGLPNVGYSWSYYDNDKSITKTLVIGGGDPLVDISNYAVAALDQTYGEPLPEWAHNIPLRKAMISDAKIINSIDWSIDSVSWHFYEKTGAYPIINPQGLKTDLEQLVDVFAGVVDRDNIIGRDVKDWLQDPILINSNLEYRSDGKTFVIRVNVKTNYFLANDADGIIFGLDCGDKVNSDGSYYYCLHIRRN